jgi:hypothetical protein
MPIRIEAISFEEVYTIRDFGTASFDYLEMGKYLLNWEIQSVPYYYSSSSCFRDSTSKVIRILVNLKAAFQKEFVIYHLQILS